MNSTATQKWRTELRAHRTAAWIVIGVLAVCPYAAGTAAAAELRAQITDQDGKPVEDAVVVAKSTVPAAAAPRSKTETVLVDQVDKNFVPYVKTVLVGSLVNFPNKDNIRHHVYSFSSAKKFELPLYSGSSAPPVLFDKPGVVVLGCNIHDWMIGYIYVADTPYFGKTTKEGSMDLKNLPAGTYDVRVWHPRMKESEDTTVRRAVLAGSEVVDLQWHLDLKPDTRVRRAPAVGGANYH